MADRRLNVLREIVKAVGISLGDYEGIPILSAPFAFIRPQTKSCYNRRSNDEYYDKLLDRFNDYLRNSDRISPGKKYSSAKWPFMNESDFNDALIAQTIAYYYLEAVKNLEKHRVKCMESKKGYIEKYIVWRKLCYFIKKVKHLMAHLRRTDRAYFVFKSLRLSLFSST